MFIENSWNRCLESGDFALVTLQGWMFNSSFEKFRSFIQSESSLRTMVHLGTRAFDSIGGEVVSTTAFVFQKIKIQDFKGSYLNLTEGKSEDAKRCALGQELSKADSDKLYVRSFNQFQNVSGAPMAYWASELMLKTFSDHKPLGKSTDPRSGMATGDNDRFLRLWAEVAFSKVGFNYNSRDEAKSSLKHWFPYNKGGTYRRWYGNNEYLVLFYDDGKLIKDKVKRKYCIPN